ncbi:hypothetical protein Hte_005868 [Hypoxylon texense]
MSHNLVPAQGKAPVRAQLLAWAKKDSRSRFPLVWKLLRNENHEENEEQLEIISSLFDGVGEDEVDSAIMWALQEQLGDATSLDEVEMPQAKRPRIENDTTDTGSPAPAPAPTPAHDKLVHKSTQTTPPPPLPEGKSQSDSEADSQAAAGSPPLSVTLSPSRWVSKDTFASISNDTPPVVKDAIILILLAESEDRIQHTKIFSAVQCYTYGNFRRAVGLASLHYPVPSRAFVEALATLARTHPEVREDIYTLIPSLDPKSADPWTWNSRTPLAVRVRMPLGGGGLQAYRIDPDKKLPKTLNVPHTGCNEFVLPALFSYLSKMWNHHVDTEEPIPEDYKGYEVRI